MVGHALDAGAVPVSLLMTDRQARRAETGALLDRVGDIPVYTAPEEVLEQLTGYRMTRGILCAMQRPAPVDPMALLTALGPGRHRVAVLEDIIDPTNVGAILRSAAALGMDALLLSPSCCDPLHRRAIRVSMGTVFQLPWARLGEGWQRQMQSAGWRTAAMALDERAVPVTEPALAAEEKLAILLGTEGTGLRPETIAGADYTVMIPMAHGVDSLNVGAAAAVAFWQLGRL